MKTVIEMSRKSGFLIDGVQEFVFAPSSFHFTEELKRFAELVRADERARMAEQPAQQEPVAWEVGVVNGVVTRQLASPASPPAQRTWVGLTDEEVTKMPAWIYSPDQDGMTAEEGLEAFARAIEDKLKEKNT